jgi:hypothetical protein
MDSLILLSDWNKSQTEFWKPIAGYANYDVSSLGRVRTRWPFKVPRTKVKRLLDEPRILHQFVHPRGYCMASLAMSGKTKTQFRVNRLVTQAFIPNPLTLPDTNHKNGVKTDNRVDNLEWASDLINQRHAWDTGLKHGQLYKMRKYSPEIVADLRRRAAAGERVGTIANEYSMDQALAWRIVKRQSYAIDIDWSIGIERLSRPSQ